ncbi:hypothetical protein AVEN_164262-1 [Araneus ventricosus]|uniref:Uncharacterized protein n=1 Tax=Araneus ventricosus TaxID=182803 RepID=A0A4Y2I325_ARAVE|nr:hypothetical protein AVEN_164262-1 [Araneus ventricosus]
MTRTTQESVIHGNVSPKPAELACIRPICMHSLVYLSMSILKPHAGYFGTDLVALNSHQMTETISDPAIFSPNLCICGRPSSIRICDAKFNIHRIPIHDGS